MGSRLFSFPKDLIQESSEKSHSSLSVQLWKHTDVTWLKSEGVMRIRDSRESNVASRSITLSLSAAVALMLLLSSQIQFNSSPPCDTRSSDHWSKITSCLLPDLINCCRLKIDVFVRRDKYSFSSLFLFPLFAVRSFRTSNGRVKVGEGSAITGSSNIPPQLFSTHSSLFRLFIFTLTQSLEH